MYNLHLVSITLHLSASLPLRFPAKSKDVNCSARVILERRMNVALCRGEIFVLVQYGSDQKHLWSSGAIFIFSVTQQSQLMYKSISWRVLNMLGFVHNWHQFNILLQFSHRLMEQISLGWTSVILGCTVRICCFLLVNRTAQSTRKSTATPVSRSRQKTDCASLVGKPSDTVSKYCYLCDPMWSTSWIWRDLLSVLRHKNSGGELRNPKSPCRQLRSLLTGNETLYETNSHRSCAHLQLSVICLGIIRPVTFEWSHPAPNSCHFRGSWKLKMACVENGVHSVWGLCLSVLMCILRCKSTYFTDTFCWRFLLNICSRSFADGLVSTTAKINAKKATESNLSGSIVRRYPFLSQWRG